VNPFSRWRPLSKPFLMPVVVMLLLVSLLPQAVGTEPGPPIPQASSTGQVTIVTVNALQNRGKAESR
jgi:hypothetical protein